MTTYEELAPRLARSTFRSRFHLTEKDKAWIAAKGWNTVQAQAAEVIRTRLGAAHPFHDGSQTPMRGYAVFVAQHATGCCCRGCLAKWHNIPEGRELTGEEINSIAAVILGYLRREAGDLNGFDHTPDLWEEGGRK